MIMGDDAAVLREAICLTRKIHGLTEAVDELSVARGQVVFSLYQEHGWTIREIAAALGISAPAVWQVINKHKKGMSSEQGERA
jgi:DNA-directed RNA polymerase specialized sigma24 family protein